MPEPERILGTLRFGAFEADLPSGELRKHGMKIKLQDQPFQILTMLLERSGQVVTREELRLKLWPGDTFVDFDHGLNNAINRLREALNDSADTPRFIETLPRRGYRFVGPVDRAAAAEQVPAAHFHPEARSVEVAPIERPAAGAATLAGLRRRLRKFWAVEAGLGIAGALMLGLILSGRHWRALGPVSGQIHSLAVLPLENLSGDPSQEYFADGMTDALTTELAQVRALQVISRTSVVRYKGAKKPLSEIARELKVDAVVEGAVVQSGERVHMTAQLIDGASDRHLWARSYEVDVRDVAALEGEVARDIVREMRTPTTPEERVRLARARKINSEAYDLYLRARVHVGLVNMEDNQAVINRLERAVAIDPGFALGYAELARAYRTRAFVLAPNEKQWEEKAFVDAEKALLLDPEAAEAYVSRGSLLWSPSNHYPHEKAVQDFRRALALNPNLAEAHHQLANVYNHIGLLDKGLAEVQKAVALDPQNTGARFRVGINLLYQQKYEESLASIRDSQRFFPSLWAFQTSFALYHLGRREEAAGQVEEFLKKYPQDTGGLLASMQAMFAAAAGHPRQAEDKIRKAIKIGEGFQHFHHTAYIIASAYALMNKPQSAMKYLRMAANDGFPCYPLFDGDPNLNNLRQRPQFIRFMTDLKKQWEHYKATL